MPQNDPIDTVLDYHVRTKHHLHRFAASLGYLDWATQPDPFRIFAGAPSVDLPLSADRLALAGYDDLYSAGTTAASPVNRETVAALLELSLGISAWKQSGSTRWALRCNPSSGNLHPTEGYVILPELPDLPAGVYHYLPRDHRLERRCTPAPGGDRGGAAAGLEHNLAGAFLVGLSSIHWRESWKYGERAFRYCQHDIGHAIAAVRFAAAALGWKAVLLDVSDAAIAGLLGLAREEDVSGIDEADREHPAALLAVGPDRLTSDFGGIDIDAVQEVLTHGEWTGRPNTLSPEHVPWPVINDAADAARRTVSGARTAADRIEAAESLPHEPESRETGQVSAATIIRQRRSAVALDDSTAISALTFYRMLSRLLPRAGAAPWDVLPWSPHVHCGIFVHRVSGLASGLYLFLRNPGSYDKVAALLHPTFAFEHPEGCPAGLPLFRLMDGDFRRDAQIVSCRQEIAGAGAFSLGMIAEFGGSLRSRGAWWYRRLFWEAGVLGQTLYLEAEAAGIRGTGIGCYFDDAFHTILGLQDIQLQSLYHFTAGGPIEDGRIQTVPAYAHLNGRDLGR